MFNKGRTQRGTHQHTFVLSYPVVPKTIDPIGIQVQPPTHLSVTQTVCLLRDRPHWMQELLVLVQTHLLRLPLFLCKLRNKILLIHEYMRGLVGGLARGGMG